MAHEHKAINLSQGFPDFEPDAFLIDLVNKAMKAGYNQYAPLGGIYTLREKISEKIEDLYGAKYHPEKEITVTVGATQAIYTAISAFVWPKDEVIVFKPAYDCYEPAIKANGGIPVLLQLEGKEYRINWKKFEESLNSNTRMVIINTPHNPSGTVLSEEDMLKMSDLLENTNTLVLSDEVYEHLVFDEHRHESVSRFAQLAERSLVCASFGKTYHVTGWKMGYCAAPAPLMKEFQKIHEFNVFCANHPIQRALAEYLNYPKYYLELGPYFQEKRSLFLSGIKESRFEYTPSEGTYFQLLDYSNITDEPDVSFAERLTRDYSIASIPISVFNLQQKDYKQLRFCFAKKEETLLQAIEILNRI